MRATGRAYISAQRFYGDHSMDIIDALIKMRELRRPWWMNALAHRTVE